MDSRWLFERMAGFGREPALIWDDAVTSYAELLVRCDAFGAELERAGIDGGSVVAVRGAFSPHAVALVLALIRARAIVVPLTPQSEPNRAQFEEVAEVQHGFAFDASDHWTTSRYDRAVTNPLTQKLISRGHPGLVIFSSGSTGAQKGVLHDCAALLEKFRVMGQRKSTLTFLLFDHIGGIDTLFNTLANGGTLVTVASRDPDAVCRAIATHRVHTLPTSPTFLNLLLISEAWRQYDLSSLRVIAYGTEPMPQRTLLRLAEVFPEVRLVQTYGLSELGVLRASARENGSLWLKFSARGFETKIVDGVLWVRTPTAMLGYLNAPDLFDADGWLNTQDAVEVDGEYVRIVGRVTDLINVGGQKVYPAEVENVLLSMENVRDVAVYGERSPLTGQFVAAKINLISPEPFDAFKRRLRAFCRTRLASYKVPLRIELVDGDQFGARFKKVRPSA